MRLHWLTPAVVAALLICNSGRAAAPGQDGDHNEDGIVDAADYVAWRKIPLNFWGDLAGYNDWYANFAEESLGPGAISGGPTVQIVRNGTQANGYLNADGNWVWTVRPFQSSSIVNLPDPDGGGPQPDPAPGSPLAAELGFQTTNSPILGVTVNSTDFDDPNPGKVIFGWEDLTNLGGSGACGSATPGSCPVGLRWAGNDANAPNNQAFTAFGSVDYGSDADGKDYVTFVTRGPRSDITSYSLSALGSYGGNKGRIAEVNQGWDGDGTPPISLNYDKYNNTMVWTALAGDANLDGSVNDADYQLWLANIGVPLRRWQHGNFDNHLNNVVDGADYNIWLNGTPLPGDFNFDEIVDAADYALWRNGPTALTQSGYTAWHANFGRTLDIGGGSAEPSLGAGVPEPSVVSLSFWGGIVLLVGLVRAALGALQDPRRPQLIDHCRRGGVNRRSGFA